MQPETTRYRERTTWNGVAYALLWGVTVLSCYPIVAGWQGGPPPTVRWPLVSGIVGGVGLLTWMVGGLTVLVQRTRIVLHLGWVPLVRRTVAFDEIVRLESVRYRPIREYGGWGVRGLGKKSAWSARGDRAVRLELTGGRSLLIGSDHPLRLEERIRTLAGEALSLDEPARR